MRASFLRTACWSGCLPLLLTGMSMAQLPMPSSPLLESFVSPEARLEMMEKTYASKLAPIHGPVMQDYLRELDLLKSKMTASGRAADALAVDTEIARVRQAMATTGIFPYANADGNPPADPAKGPGAGAPDAAKPAPDTSSPRTVLALQAARANGGNIAPGSAAPLGALDWTVEKLASGTYDVAMVYACPSLDSPEHITMSFAGVTQVFTLPADRATGSDKDFRIFRLGTITLEREVASGNARLQASSASPRLWIRSMILSRPKPPAAQQTAPAGS